LTVYFRYGLEGKYVFGRNSSRSDDHEHVIAETFIRARSVQIVFTCSLREPTLCLFWCW